MNISTWYCVRFSSDREIIANSVEITIQSKESLTDNNQSESLRRMLKAIAKLSIL